jgi:hypothetical protein
MPIDQLLQHGAFDPEVINAMRTAFEDALRTLNLVEQDGPTAILVAKNVIACAKGGERDPIRLRDCALKALKA